jgi:beta-glucanase (GH16 family)
MQTNVFLSGVEDLQVVDLPYDSSQEVHRYAIEWCATWVKFFVDGNPEPVRTVTLSRPLKPLALHASVWTTSKGWPGLLRWGGETDWKSRPNFGDSDVPIEAIFKVTQLPEISA